MIKHLLRTAPAPITAVCLLGGFGLIATGYLPAAIAGSVLILLGLLVPFLRLPIRSGEAIERRTEVTAEHPKTELPSTRH